VDLRHSFTMSYRHTLTERVQFADTDMAGIVHFSNFFRYMERVEHDFFRLLELSIREDPAKIPAEECVGWPRVHASCDYKAPLFFEEQFTMELIVEEIRSKTVRYLIRFWKLTGELCAEGRIIAACVRRDADTGKMKAVEIPARCLAKIAVAPAELLAAVSAPSR
jgi:acyl-CoA thioester hydrolase